MNHAFANCLVELQLIMNWIFDMENRDDSAYYYISTEFIEYDKPFLWSIHTLFLTEFDNFTTAHIKMCNVFTVCESTYLVFIKSNLNSQTDAHVFLNHEER